MELQSNSNSPKMKISIKLITILLFSLLLSCTENTKKDNINANTEKELIKSSLIDMWDAVSRVVDHDDLEFRPRSHIILCFPDRTAGRAHCRMGGACRACRGVGSAAAAQGQI